jgi:hypothetical protein
MRNVLYIYDISRLMVKHDCGRIDAQASKIPVDYPLPVVLASEKICPNFSYNSLR